MGVADLLRRQRFTCVNESELQDAIASVFDGAAITFAREVSIGPDRIDFMVGDLGVEVKVKGSRASVIRQLHRYARSPKIGSLLLVTTRRQHAVPPLILGKAVDTVCVAAL